jgi:peptidoglycan hydrolase-like protein with peptidoglycan-binding domain
VKAFLACLLTLAFLGAAALPARADEVVAAAQSKLQKMGCYDGTVDGVWGSQTAAAVRRFQLAKDLRVTGELNRETIEALSIKIKPAATPVPFPVAIADIFMGGPYINAPTEIQVQTLRQAQENLRLLGFYRGPIDGNPTAALRDALRAYQKAHRFSASGRLDKTTLQALDLLTLPYSY